ncbi:MAG: CYTH domain-containing protein [Azoarcus sp.]|jgi:adenylate cyclase|nr:CYTH domain-containing protein [Azoarcus sp.]
MPLEIELKLSFPETALAALHAHPLITAAPHEGEAEVLESTYYDTPAWALQARKIALRLRKTGGGTVQTAKCAAPSHAGLTHRPEWEQTWDGAFEFSGIDDPAVAAALEEARDELQPVFSTRFHRDTRRFEPRPGVRILAMIDTGSIEADARREPICELELELVAGEPAELTRLADELRKTLPLCPEDASKAERGYQLAARAKRDD